MRRMQMYTLRWVALIASGSGLLVLDTCNPNVRGTVLSGVSSAATGLTATFIQAFFEGLAADEEADPVL